MSPLQQQAVRSSPPNAGSFGRRRKPMAFYVCCGIILMTQFLYWRHYDLTPWKQQQKQQSVEKQQQQSAAEFASSKSTATSSLPRSSPATNASSTLSLHSHPLSNDSDIRPTTKSSDFDDDASTPNHSSFPPPQVVILPGPHKAGSTSLQYCMVDWTQNNYMIRLRQEQWETHLKHHTIKRRRWEKIQKRNQRQAIAQGKEYVNETMPLYLLNDPKPIEPRLPLPGWSWPIPDLNATGLVLHITPQKGFASLMAVADDDVRMTARHVPLTVPERDHVLQLFQSSMVEAWYANYKIVFGSEEFDRIAHPKNTHSKKNGSQLLDSILEVLPWNSTVEKVRNETGLLFNATNLTASTAHRPALQRQDLETVIVYRAPRVQHLKSLWHEVGGPNQTMAEFLIGDDSDNGHSPALDSYASILDTLALAERFVDADIRTTIIDMTGINRGSNLCHVVACQIMGDVDCNDNYGDNNSPQIASLARETFNVSDEDRGNIDISTRKWNQRSDDFTMIGLTAQQLDDIDSIMQEYDCGWKEGLLMRKNALTTMGFRILHQHSLFAGCDDKETPKRPLLWMVQEIRKIASQDEPAS